MTGRPDDALVGKAATAGGSLGLTIQWLTDFGSLIVIALNIVLALGGLYLLYLRTLKARRELRGGGGRAARNHAAARERGEGETPCR